MCLFLTFLRFLQKRTITTNFLVYGIACPLIVSPPEDGLLVATPIKDSGQRFGIGAIFQDVRQKSR